MIEVRTTEQLNVAIRTLRAGNARGLGPLGLFEVLEIDPYTELRGGDWRYTNFARCDLRDIDFSDCRLAFCDFTNADVAGAIFYGADLYRSTLHRAQNLAQALLTGAQIEAIRRNSLYDDENSSEEARRFRMNQKIRAATTFNGAAIQFSRIIDDGLQPDEYSAGLLISRAQTPEQAWQGFQLVEGARCALNEIVFNALATKMRATSDVRDVINIMRAKGVKPGIWVYNKLLSRTSGQAGTNLVLEEIERERIARDNFTYGVLLTRLRSFPGRTQLLREMPSRGLRPRAQELNILLEDVNTEDEADDVVDLANELGVKLNLDSYALLARFKARPSAFRTLTDEMVEVGLFRNTLFYVQALQRARAFENACFLYGQMKADRIPADERIFDAFARWNPAANGAADPGREQWPEQAIDALIVRVGTKADRRAAGLD